MNLALVLAVMVHATLASVTGLTGDEAHYLLYARFLDWSYFDHPPLVGWIQAPVIAITDSVAIIRLLPQLVWIGCAWLIYRITQDLSQDVDAPSLAVILFCLSPVLHIHGIALLPDTLLCLFALLAGWLSLKIGKKLRQIDDIHDAYPNRSIVSLWYWALLGLVLGLAGLSKYSAIFLALGLAIYFLGALGGRLPLTGVAVTVAVGMLIVSPVFLWNAAHDWISFKYQGAHVSGGAWRPEMVIAFLLAQLLVFGPVTVWGLVRFWQRRTNTLIDPSSIWLLAAFILPLVMLAYLAGGGRSLPYWTSPAWVLAVPFAAVGLGGMGMGLKSEGSRVSLVTTVVLAFIQIVLIAWTAASLILGRPTGWTNHTDQTTQGASTPPSQSVPESRKASNPFADVYGWDQIGTAVIELSRETGITTLAIGNWTLGSRLGWYARPLPVWVTDSRFDQFDLWMQKPQADEPVLFVQWSEMPSATGYKSLYDCKMVREVSIKHIGKVISFFTVSICRVAGPLSK